MDNSSHLKNYHHSLVKVLNKLGTNILLGIKYELKACNLQEETKISAYFKNLLAYKHLKSFYEPFNF